MYQSIYPKRHWDSSSNGVLNLELSTDELKVPENGKILFLGSLNYHPNVEGLFWFLDHIYPKVRNQCTLTVAGSHPTSEVKTRLNLVLNCLGGRPCVSFDGNDTLVATTASKFAFMHSGTGSTMITLWGHNSATGGFYSPLLTMSLTNGSRGVGMALNDNTINEGFRVYQGGAGNDLFAYLNKSTIGATPASSAFNASDSACALTIGLACGSTYPITEKMAEVLVYNFDLTDAERLRVERWLENMYEKTFPTTF